MYICIYTYIYIYIFIYLVSYLFIYLQCSYIYIYTYVLSSTAKCGPKKAFPVKGESLPRNSFKFGVRDVGRYPLSYSWFLFIWNPDMGGRAFLLWWLEDFKLMFCRSPIFKGRTNVHSTFCHLVLDLPNLGLPLIIKMCGFWGTPFSNKPVFVLIIFTQNGYW